MQADYAGSRLGRPRLARRREPIVQFADVKRLPHSYVGERHLVQIDRLGSERPVYEERPGPGPDIETDPNTIVVFFVPSPRESQAVA